MFLKQKYFVKFLEHSSVKVMNKIAKTDINLNFIIFNFYLFLKTKVSQILLKII